MEIEVLINNSSIILKSNSIDDVYFIDKDENDGKFYIWSRNGYDGHLAEGYKHLERAIMQAKTLIHNYFSDRCMEEETTVINLHTNSKNKVIKNIKSKSSK
jgi:hypothetical protein